MNKFRVLIIMAMVAMLGFGSTAFAGKKKGKNGADGLSRCAAFKSLSAEDQQKVKTERDAFHNDVKAIKTQIHQKRQELKSEMAKPQSDAQKASALQKEISDLRAQIGQKYIQYQLNLKNINPALSDCFKGGKKEHKKKDQTPDVAPAPSQG
jgi:Spy/CpxP family protein refolding chaperone